MHNEQELVWYRQLLLPHKILRAWSALGSKGLLWRSSDFTSGRCLDRYVGRYALFETPWNLLWQLTSSFENILLNIRASSRRQSGLHCYSGYLLSRNVGSKNRFFFKKNIEIFHSYFLRIVKIKWPKSEEKLEFGGRLGWWGQTKRPPPNRPAGSASEHLTPLLA